jgi:Type III secretion system, cytoplasmic E component of needle
MKQATRMLDLEERLYADKDGTAKAALLADLQAMQFCLRGDLRKLNDRQTHLELQGALQAVTSALEVIRTLRMG